MNNPLETSSGKPYPYGSTEMQGGTNFAVYAKEPKKISLCLFEEKNPHTPFQEITLDPVLNKTGDVWHIHIKGLPPYTLYAYRIVGNEDPKKSYLLLDPYAKAVASDPKWFSPSAGKESTYQPLGKVMTSHEFDWEGDKPPGIDRQDLIIYEMHVRGFTQHGSSGVNHPGTYLGLIEKIPYLLDLGINAVELMPIHEFNEKEVLLLEPKTKRKLCNYFGYSTVNFFSPMVRYASQSERDQAIIEFKTMVRELHKNGIEVILDVVFNHTSEGNEKGPEYCFKRLDRPGYYMVDETGKYQNFSGCGNTFNCNHPIARELILDALRYWVVEMHVDGFRFDIASILSRAENGAPLANPPVIEAMSKDPILSKTKLIAEPWDAGGLYQVGAFMPGNPRWSEWNGKYRDIVRRFIKGNPWHKNIFATAICGSQDLYGIGRTPYCSLNFVTAHDGFSLADLVSYNQKHNLQNGEKNKDGFDHNDSWNCGAEGHSTNQKVIALRERQMRNFMLALFISQGIPMVVMGDEYGHSRNGNNNTWCQDNELNWFLWDHFDNHPGFYRFYKSLIHLRKKYSTFRRKAFLTDKDITWHGLQPQAPHWDNDNRFIAFSLKPYENGPEFYLAFNASHTIQTVVLPPPPAGQAWYWVVNTHNTPPDDFYDEEHRKKVEGTSIRLHSYSSMMLIALKRP